MGHTRISKYTLSLLIILVLLCTGCNSSPQVIAQPEDAILTAGVLKISADRFSDQLCVSIDGFRFYLCNASGNPQSDWSSLAVTDSSDGDMKSFDITSGSTPADDIYLYIAYPSETYTLSTASIDQRLSSEYLVLSVPDAADGVAAVGLSRIGSQRGIDLDSGHLISIDFKNGPTKACLSVSSVNMDPRTKSDLYLESDGCLGPVLVWEDNNIGDYNDNGLVEVSDLTPLAVHFNQELSEYTGYDEIDHIDGNGDGWITVQDMTEIGAHFNTGINAYRVFRTTGTGINDDDSSAEIVEDAERRCKRNQSYRVGWYDEAYNFYVRPIFKSGDSVSLGIASNLAPLEDPEEANRPYWEEGNGILSHEVNGTEVTVQLSKAIDPNGDKVSYLLKSVTAGSPVGMWDEYYYIDVPPYTKTIDLKYPGRYLLGVSAWDETGLRVFNSYEYLLEVPSE